MLPNSGAGTRRYNVNAEHLKLPEQYYNFPYVMQLKTLPSKLWVWVMMIVSDLDTWHRGMLVFCCNFHGKHDKKIIQRQSHLT